MPLIEERVNVSLKKILLATDFSLASDKAAAYAKGLARRFASTVEVAHVLDPSAVTTYEEAIIGLPLARRREIISDQLEQIKADFNSSGIRAEAALSEGHNPVTSLLKRAKEQDVDLIIAGTESKSGIKRFALGSTAEGLIRNAGGPVLTIGPNAKPPADGPLAFKNIIFATDFSKESADAAIYALSFAQDSGAHLYFCYVLSIHPDTRAKSDFLDEAFKSALNRMIPQSSYDWCNPECVVEHGDAAEEIIKVADRVNADLIVLGARKASFWLTHIARGLTPDLLAQANCPVMTVC
jgi:nucleotide-binding universal stress UspA family protein